MTAHLPKTLLLACVVAAPPTQDSHEASAELSTVTPDGKPVSVVLTAKEPHHIAQVLRLYPNNSVLLEGEIVYGVWQLVSIHRLVGPSA